MKPRSQPNQGRGEAPPPADLAALSRLADGFLITQLLGVAVELGIGSALAAGPRRGAELAAAVGADPDRLTRVLRGLAAEGVLDEAADGKFALTSCGAALPLLEGAIRVRAGLYNHAAGRLVDAVRAGGVPFELAHGVSLFAHLDGQPEHAAAFHASMADRSQQEAREVVAAYDFGGVGRVVDVGGGVGRLLAEILLAAPDATGELIDRPAAVAAARSTLDAAGVGPRASCTEGDFFEALPTGGDVYLLSRVLHDWADDDARRILRSCSLAMTPAARLLIVDVVLGRRPADNPAAVRMDLLMMVLLGARERTEAELASLLADTGFALRRCVDTGSASGIAILEASLC
ncbi:MAG: methyltransferase [Acidimicrobiales bacterium]